MVYEMFPQSKHPEKQFVGFASDNYAAAHPKVIEWLAAANSDYARPYNDDIYTSRFRKNMSELFGKSVSVFPSLNGTGTNVLCLRAVLPRWGTVCAPETAHINTDEAGAPEHMAGLKIMTSPTKDGKMTPDDIRNIARALGDIHSAQPAIVSVSNTTERGTFYTSDELGALAETAHGQGMLIHVDGARLFNAIAAEGFKTLGDGLAAQYGQTGIDVISFGGTKVGAMSAEAVVVLHPEGSDLVHGAKFSQKQMGQLGSKARYSSAQFLALLEDDLALKLAEIGNEKMNQLFKKYVKLTNAKAQPPAFLSGATSAYASKENTSFGDSMHYFEDDDDSMRFSFQSKPDANALFPTMPTAVVQKLRETHHFYDINSDGLNTTIRLMTCWATNDDDIDTLIKTIAKASGLKN